MKNLLVLKWNEIMWKFNKSNQIKILVIVYRRVVDSPFELLVRNISMKKKVKSYFDLIVYMQA